MRSEYPAGLSRSDIDYILKSDSVVTSCERLEGPAAAWRITVSYEENPPVEMFVDNGINDVFVWVFLPIDGEHIIEALQAIGDVAVVGLCVVDDKVYMRSSFFIEHSNMHAFTNTYRAVALAHTFYQSAISQS